jgi:hypothetical protein
MNLDVVQRALVTGDGAGAYSFAVVVPADDVADLVLG